MLLFRTLNYRREIWGWDCELAAFALYQRKFGEQATTVSSG